MHKKNWKPVTRYAMRFDGESGGGSSAPAAPAAPVADPTPTNPANPNSAPAKLAEPAAQPFKSFATQSEFDQFVQQALKSREESLKAKLTPEIKAQLDKESKMTAEQKVQAQLDQIETDKKALAKEKVRIKVESLFASKDISEADRQPMLDSVVDDDEESSLKRAQVLIDAIDKATNEKIKDAMTKVKPPAGGGDGKPERKAVEFAKGYAKRRAAESKASNDILNQYLHKS